MRKLLKIVALAGLILAVAATAGANTFPNVVKWIQDPDPYGWDVNVTFDPDMQQSRGVADDWLCTQSGPVTDVHLWVSFKGDVGDPSYIQMIDLKIFSDIPADPDGPGPLFSQPGLGLKGWLVGFDQFTWEGPYIGDQGWITPGPDPQISEHDHDFYYRIDIDLSTDPFVQQAGNVYWLGATMMTYPFGEEVFEKVYAGWKTTEDHWNDDAVYWDVSQYGWRPVSDHDGNSLGLDMAFVITTPIPEPLTMLGVFLGVSGLGGYLKRRLA